jgi:hypothetical protein
MSLQEKKLKAQPLYNKYICTFLVNDQHDAQFFSMYLFLTLYMFRAHCAHHQETNCVNTASGNCHSVSVAVSCAGWKFTSDLHTTRPVPVSCIPSLKW